MRRPGALVTLGFLLLATALVGWRVAGSADRPPQLLNGDLWQTLSPDAKAAFVWGIGNLVEFERAQGAVSRPGARALSRFWSRA